jgi:hypothetical protein
MDLFAWEVLRPFQARHHLAEPRRESELDFLLTGSSTHCGPFETYVHGWHLFEKNYREENRTKKREYAASFPSLSSAHATNFDTTFKPLYLHPHFTLDLQRAPNQLQIGLKSVIEWADKGSRAVIRNKQNYIREDLTPTTGSSVLLTYPCVSFYNLQNYSDQLNLMPNPKT